MSTRIPSAITALLLMLFAPVAIAGPDEIETRVEPAEVSWGESVTLQIRLRGSLTGSEPDLSPLDSAFEVLDVGQSQRLSIINGVRDASTDWTITLLPKSTGTVEIPALSVGSDRTEAVSVSVLAGNPRMPSARGDEALAQTAPAFVQVRAERPNPYEQERLLLRVRLYAGPEVIEGVLHDLDIDGASAVRIGDDRSFREEIGGRSYRGIERTFSLLPEAPGKLVVPPVAFEGFVREQNPVRSRRHFGSFGSSLIDEFLAGTAGPGDLFSRFVNRGRRRLLVRSEPLTLEVRPRPEASKDSWWLPAREVSLSESWDPEPQQVKVGEALTRRITLRAEGAGLAQLPALATPPTEGVKQYAEAPESRETEAGSVRVQEITVIPTQPGRVELPPIEVAWWDTTTDTPQVASLAAQSIEVMGTPATTEPMASGSAAPAPHAPAPSPAPDEPAPMTSSLPRPLLWAAGLILLCGLAGVWVRHLLGRRQPRPAVNAPKLRTAERSLRRACRRSDPAEAERALHQVMRARDPGHTQIAGQQWALDLGSDDLAREIARLRNARYSSSHPEWSGAPLWRAYRSIRRRRAGRKRKADAGGLPPLYPGRAQAGEPRGAR